MIHLAITERGWGWDIRHSLWILWALTTVLGFISFLYIGRRAKKKKWVYWGLGYIVIPIMGLTGALISPDKGSSLPSNILIYTSSGLGLFCLGHAIFALPEYLRAIDFLETGFIPIAPGAREPSKFPLPAEATGSSQAGEAVGSRSAVLVVPDGPGRVVDVAPVNINSADIEALCSLPGMDPALAAKAVELRTTSGPFTTSDAFCEALGLDAETTSRLKTEITLGSEREGPSAPMGRRVDY